MSYQYAPKARNFPSTISYSFCCSKSPVAMISSKWLHYLRGKPQTSKHRTPGHRRANTPKGQNTEKSWYQLPKLETEYYIILLSCHGILINHIALIHHIILIYIVLIVYSHYNNTPSWHHIPSYWYHAMLIYCVVSYHMIRIFQLLIQYHTYISKARQ